MEDVTVDIGESHVSAVEPVGELGVVQPEEMQHGQQQRREIFCTRLRALFVSDFEEQNTFTYYWVPVDVLNLFKGINIKN